MVGDDIISKMSRSITILKEDMKKNRGYANGAVIYLPVEIHLALHKFAFANRIHVEEVGTQILSSWALKQETKGSEKQNATAR